MAADQYRAGAAKLLAQAAAALFADNPHLTMPGATVEVMEITAMPGR